MFTGNRREPGQNHRTKTLILHAISFWSRGNFSAIVRPKISTIC